MISVLKVISNSGIVIITPLSRKLRAIGSLLLRPPALFYAALMAGRNLVYDLLPGLSRAVNIPIICVGNLTTGGTGKTPMVIFLARHFRARGLRVAVLSRGYGRKNRQAQVIIPAATKAETLTPDEIGDEVLMLKQLLPETVIVLDADRRRGAEKIVENSLADLILMDDGFQHRSLRRDFNLIMVDSQRFFGNRQTLPAGPLRESISSLKRADAVIFNKFDQRRPDFYTQAAAILNHIAPNRLFCAAYRYHRFSPLGNGPAKTLEEMKKKGPFCAVSGLANNDYFFTQLKASGLDIVKTIPFKDHHNYTPNDLVALKKSGREYTLLTTAKDADKLRLLVAEADDQFRQKIWVAEIRLEIEKSTLLLDLFSKISALRKWSET